MNTERRSLPLQIEFRTGNRPQFRGLASVYYDGTPKTEYRLGPNIIERVHPGAFDEVLASGADILALYNHDENMLLGRLRSGSLKLKSEARGLAYAVPYDETDPTHQTVAARIRRGDAPGSSVTWKIGEDGQSFERRSSDGAIIRNIHRVGFMIDVGPTHSPAYTSTTAEMRSDPQYVPLAERDVESLAELAQQYLLEPPTPVEFWNHLHA